jgi:hypothetical protein
MVRLGLAEQLFDLRLPATISVSAARANGAAALSRSAASPTSTGVCIGRELSRIEYASSFGPRGDDVAGFVMRFEGWPERPTS